MSTLLSLDNRKRISLGALAQNEHYLVTVEDGGRTIILRSAVILSEDEAALLRNPKLIKAAEAAIDTPLSELQLGRQPRRSA